ncbi:response regulator transcription factor [Leuconostoc lactis]|uniref:response regulator transcription factor n=1 Tax=Leuconostoc lactis TaxID=1246 RepID=UPI0024AD46C9|nr:response regulator transcription factor [Leuconostoc lactis]MDI6496442.1 response regulator transcription factor [Leuconostoc lactis]
MIKKQILVVEDDQTIQRVVKQTLVTAGFEVTQAFDAHTTQTQLLATLPDLLILDLGLPDEDGVALLKKIRLASHVPVLVLTARDQTQDKLTLFEIGVDDYVTKPFEPLELVARVRAILSRTYATTGVGKGQLQCGELTVDLDAQTVMRSTEVLHLSQKEYALLSLFIQHPQKVLTYAVLLRNIWGTHLLQGQNDTLRVTVAHLRRKIGTNAGQQYIGTDVGVGYRWLSPVTMHALLEQ